MREVNGRCEDAAFYTLFEFIGGITGILVALLLFGKLLARHSVKLVARVAGPTGPINVASSPELRA